MTQPKRGPGRPAFVPTKQQRENVSVWKAGGMTDEQIAYALKIDCETMKKYFRHELDAGYSEKRAAMLTALYKTGIKGNVSAQKHFLQLAGVVAAIEDFKGPSTPKEERRARERPLGKKEHAQIAAQSAGEGTDWDEDLKIAGRAH